MNQEVKDILAIANKEYSQDLTDAELIEELLHEIKILENELENERDY